VVALTIAIGLAIAGAIWIVATSGQHEFDSFDPDCNKPKKKSNTIDDTLRK